MTKEALLGLTQEFVCALSAAHRLVEGHLRGDKIDPNDIENYYVEVLSTLNKTSEAGSLISFALESLAHASLDANDDACFEVSLEPIETE